MVGYDVGRNEYISLSTLLLNCKLKDVYNKFGLFFEWSLKKIYQLKSEKCSGGNLRKIRMASLAAENAIGNKLPMFVIGKIKKPRCFKNVKFLPCRYINHQNCGIDGVLFEEWLRDIDKKFVSEGRKFALVINNFPAHLQVENLKLVKFFSLLVKATFQAQLMDQGVVHSLKAQYHNCCK